MKGLYQRGNTWWLRYSTGGRQYFESLRTDDEALAIAAARDILENPERMDAGAWKREVTEYLAGRVAKRAMSDNASKSRRDVLLAFGRDMDISHPSKVTPATVERWYLRLQASIADVTSETYVRWLKTFMETLVEARKIRVNPVDDLEIRHPRKSPRKRFCSKSEAVQLIANAPDDGLRFVLYAGFHCGLRREEISECRWSWFDLEEGILHVQRSETWEPKDRDDRSVPMTKEFLAFLKTLEPGKGFILEPKKLKKGKSRYRYDFRRPFNDYVAAQGMDWVTPHTMRRTFASLKVSAGVSLYKVAIWLGDLERVVQDHYGFLIPKDPDIEKGL